MELGLELLSTGNELAYALWLILPAYAANGAPVVFARLYPRPRHPIDFGLVLPDGRRLFGESKTWEGLAFALLVAVAVGYVQQLLGDAGALPRGGVMGLGAMLGDLLGAFIKRRAGLRSGEPAPLIDQLMFLVVAVGLVHATNLAVFTLQQLAFLIILTLALHPLTNALAYLAKLKRVPW